MYWSRNSGNVLFLILIAVALFAALSYAVTQSTGGGVIDITQEETEMDIAKVENFEAAVNGALWRLKLVNACLDSEISYETPQGDYVNPLSPVNYSCHVFRPEGGGVPYTGFVPVGAIDNDPASFAGNFNDLTGQGQNTLLTSNSVTISDINVLETITVSGGGTPEFSINGGGWTSGSASVQNGDSIQLRAYTPAASGAANNIEVTVGSQSDIWTITSQTSGTWTVGGWSSCSAPCGGGTQTRSVTCDYDVCTGTEPVSSQSCNTGSCCHPSTGQSCSYRDGNEFVGCTNSAAECAGWGGYLTHRMVPPCMPTRECRREIWATGTRQCDGSCS